MRLLRTLHQHSCTHNRLLQKSVAAHSRSISATPISHRALPFSLNPRSNASHDSDNEQHGHLRMLMFGKPGAGKGTLSARLVKKYDILSLSTGDLLRQHIAEGSEVGRAAEDIIAGGGLLPDEVMLKVVASKLDGLKDKHWILDGFPRTIGQGELLDLYLKAQNIPLTLVVNIDVPDDVILSRISDRWVHLPSGRVYNMSYNRPKVDGRDDLTGEPLTRRPDDNPEIFARRLASFYDSTSPLIAYYHASASSPVKSTRSPHQHPHQVSFHRPPALKLATISGETSDEIWPLLDRLVKSTFPGLKERSATRQARRQHSLSDAIVADDIASTGIGCK